MRIEKRALGSYLVVTGGREGQESGQEDKE